VAFRNVFLAGSVDHDRAKRGHFVANSAVAHSSAGPAFSVPLPPNGITLPFVFADKSDLDTADIAIELRSNVRVHDSPAMHADFAGLGALLLEGREVFSDLAEWSVENRDAMFEPKPNIRVVLESTLAGEIEVGRLEGDGFVSVFGGELDPAIPIAVAHVGTAEDGEARLKLFDVDEEGHGEAFLCRFCAGESANLLKIRILCRGCAGDCQGQNVVESTG